MKNHRTALIILTAKELAIFSKRAATEGQHESLAHPTGAALLGWAAAKYEDFGKSCWTIFHSGKVRFSNALPLSVSGEAAYPVPELLMSPKHGAAPVSEGHLSKEVRVGRPEKDPGGRTVQYEAVRRVFVTPSLSVYGPSFSVRRRTATELNRAAEGQLFEYQHILPGGHQRYAATIEACFAEDGGIEDSEWEMILDRFRSPSGSRTLILGRAKNSHGAFDCKVIDTGGERLWPKGIIRKGQKKLRVWALSDLALVDRFGSPCFAPEPHLIGLPQNLSLDLKQSAISTRRYSPWNGKLGGRDFERQVIQAGSVLTYKCIGGTIEHDQDSAGLVGLWQEVGLGRIWVEPSILELDHPSPMATSPLAAGSEKASQPKDIVSDPLVQWALRISQNSDTRARDQIAENLQNEFSRLYGSANRIGPSPSQWNAVATAAKEVANLRHLEDVLFHGESPVCGLANQPTRSQDWGVLARLNGKSVTFRAWLKESLGKDTPLQKLNSIRTVRWVVTQLAKHAAQAARSESAA